VNRKNSEGYPDPTAYATLKNIEREEEQVRKLRKTISQICDLAGFRVQGKISLIDKRSGKVWK